MKVAIIPARGGSKRIPRKNIRPFCGMPMILHSIDAAFEAGVFDAVIVSTDDDEIAAVAAAAGAEVPFRRPPELADDHATSVAVIAHAVRWLREAGRAPAHVCCLYATAPFVRADDLRAGLEALSNPGARFAFPITDFEFPIQRALMRDSIGGVVMREPEHLTSRSQDLTPFVHDCGQFYWGLAEAWESGEPVYSPAARTIPMPRHRVQDIDTQDDWHRAEIMYEVLSRTEWKDEK